MCGSPQKSAIRLSNRRAFTYTIQLPPLSLLPFLCSQWDTEHAWSFGPCATSEVAQRQRVRTQSKSWDSCRWFDSWSCQSSYDCLKYEAIRSRTYWWIGMFIGTRAFSVPTSSCKALSSGWAKSTAADWKRNRRGVERHVVFVPWKAPPESEESCNYFVLCGCTEMVCFLEVCIDECVLLFFAALCT